MILTLRNGKLLAQLMGSILGDHVTSFNKILNDKLYIIGGEKVNPRRP